MPVSEKSPDYYKLLLVSRSASLTVIRASYRTLMQRQHPDHGGDAGFAALLNKAYTILSDAESRAAYDAYLRALDLAGNHQRIKAPAEIGDPLHACMFCTTAHQLGKSIVADATCPTCSSPLCPVGQPRFERTGQRAVARIGKYHDIVIYTRWPQAGGFTGRSEDMSLTGMRFETRTRLRVGQYIKIESDVVAAVALVSNTSRQRHRLTVNTIAGVAFVTLRFNQSLGRFVSEKI